MRAHFVDHTSAGRVLPLMVGVAVDSGCGISIGEPLLEVCMLWFQYLNDSWLTSRIRHTSIPSASDRLLGALLTPDESLSATYGARDRT